MKNVMDILMNLLEEGAFWRFFFGFGDIENAIDQRTDVASDQGVDLSDRPALGFGISRIEVLGEEPIENRLVARIEGVSRIGEVNGIFFDLVHNESHRVFRPHCFACDSDKPFIEGADCFGVEKNTEGVMELRKPSAFIDIGQRVHARMYRSRS